MWKRASYQRVRYNCTVRDIYAAKQHAEACLHAVIVRNSTPHHEMFYRSSNRGAMSDGISKRDRHGTEERVTAAGRQSRTRERAGPAEDARPRTRPHVSHGIHIDIEDRPHSANLDVIIGRSSARHDGAQRRDFEGLAMETDGVEIEVLVPGETDSRRGAYV